VLHAFSTERFGKYQLVAHLGRGGMADVYRAVASGAAGFERVVVVKKILGPYNSDPAFVDMFINEAKIAAQLTHPNIVQVYELGEVEGEYFMAMEYVKGLDLVHALRWLAKQTPGSRAFPAAAAAFVAREVCRGLACAHEHSDASGAPKPIIHRDVSPHNIMLTYDGQVKLLDFGIAKAMYSAREETRTGALKGKIAYMSPEQVEGTSPGPEADLWATGVVLYEMLVGKRLFKGENDFDTLQRVKTLIVPPPSRLASAIAEELDAVCLRALERDRERRYRRAAQMARDLDGYLQSVRFTVDDFAEFMSATFPPEARTEVPDGAAAGTPQPSESRAETSVGKRAKQLATQVAAEEQRRAAAAAAARGGGGGMRSRWPETLIAVLVGGLVFGSGAWWILKRQQQAQSQAQSQMPVIDPGVAPLGGAAAGAPRAGEAADLGAGASAAARTPTSASPAGREHHHAAASTTTTSSSQHHSKPTELKAPKIEAFDDEPAPAHPAKKPKIDAFDD
jgi:serine/threonine protein kinase